MQIFVFLSVYSCLTGLFVTERKRNIIMTIIDNKGNEEFVQFKAAAEMLRHHKRNPHTCKKQIIKTHLKLSN